jgi:serine/threonine protein kinase
VFGKKDSPSIKVRAHCCQGRPAFINTALLLPSSACTAASRPACRQQARVYVSLVAAPLTVLAAALCCCAMPFLLSPLFLLCSRCVSLQLCDFGCSKKRSDEPRYGPASGTKDWQAPEQMAADTVKGPVGACVRGP